MTIETNTVSVVIPVYNRSSELLAALDSVYAQDCPASEVIVVDDGSDIDIKTLVNRHNPETKYIRQNHQGVSSARNKGIRSANSQWVAFLDSDDRWLPPKLGLQIGHLKKTGLLLSHTNEIWIRNGVRVNPHKKHKKYGGQIFKRCLPLCLISPSSTIIDKALLVEMGGFDETLPACEDYDLWLRMTSKMAIDYLDTPLVTKHGGHDDQLSQKYWGMDRFRIYSMEKLYQQGCLSNRQTVDLMSELIRKCRIFARGAVKHNNPVMQTKYSAKAHDYQRKMDELMS